jgi:hypothetical protein
MSEHALTFDEAPLPDVERAFERLLASGRIVSTPTLQEDLARAQVPAETGPIFRRVARAHKKLLLREVDVCVFLHEGAVASDALGGWRLRTEPPELDIRLCACEQPDWIVDATPLRGSSEERAIHSSIVHLLVRAVLGNRL